MTSDDLNLEREFLDRRLRALNQELADHEQRLGIKLTDENMGDVLHDVLDALRCAGYRELARRYVTGLMAFIEATRACKAAIERGEVIEATRDRMNEAMEDWERVHAEAQAVLDKLTEE